jgi:hypothetical protein
MPGFFNIGDNISLHE